MKTELIPQWVSRSVMLGAAVVLSACAAPTPSSRVAAAPQLYAPLPEAQKKAVMEGRVEEGMPPDAVYLACGQPDRVVRGSENGKPYELWRYTQLMPVYHAGVSMGFGIGQPYGYGRRHGFFDPAWIGYDAGPDYVPVTAVVVRFSRNRVTGWERLR
jgi:hypothetical protein